MSGSHGRSARKTCGFCRKDLIDFRVTLALCTTPMAQRPHCDKRTRSERPVRAQTRFAQTSCPPCCSPERAADLDKRGETEGGECPGSPRFYYKAQYRSLPQASRQLNGIPTHYNCCATCSGTAIGMSSSICPIPLPSGSIRIEAGPPPSSASNSM